MYVYFDGDNIGDDIELLLINEQIEKAMVLSKNLNIALETLKGELVHL